MRTPMVEQKTVWIMPGGRFQVPLIEYARSIGHRVVVSDRNPDCPGSVLADEFVQLGVDARDTLLARARELQPDAVVTDQTDGAVGVVAWLCKELGLTGIGYECAKRFTDKFQMRTALAAAGFKMPSFSRCESLAECVECAEAIGWPVMIKPLASQSSLGVNRVDDPDQMAAAFEETASLGGSAVLVEEFLDGPEFSVEGCVGAEGHASLCFSEQSHYEHRPMVADALVYSPTHPEYDYAVLRDLNDRVVGALGLPFGLTHAEYKWTGAEFQLVEIAARGGGTCVTSHLVPALTGVEPYPLYLSAALGELPPLPRASLGRCGALDFLHFLPGRVQSVEGLESVRAMPGILNVGLNYVAGEVIPEPTNATNRAGYCLTVADTRAELDELRNQVRETVSVNYEDIHAD
ncbi:MAG: ATP-grasp domain-containing protein [Verrucomicrobiota bacterium]|nr:ATP-grasp domain-containing protein [Verrucomicrobiota bacterium]